MLCQIMLVFDGDVNCYSQVEALLPYLEGGILLLNLSSQQMDTTHALLTYPSVPARAAWKSYLFRKTFRRTVLLLFQLVALCGLLRGQHDLCAQGLCQRKVVTLSTSLACKEYL